MIRWASIAPGTEIKFARVDRNLPPFKEPVYDNGDAGYDLYAREDTWVWPWKVKKIPVNLCLELPKGIFARICGRSGMSILGKIVVAGTVDASYRGEVHVMMYSLLPRKICKGDRIAQVIFMPCLVANTMLEMSKEQLSKTARGAQGFGSSGSR